MTQPLYRILVLSAALSLVAACGRSPAPGQGTSTPASATSTSGPNGVQVDTKRYAIDITYPPLSPQADALTRLLHQRAAVARQEFMKAVSDAGKSTAMVDRKLRLVVEFEVASRTPGFLSVREKGMMDTGGAHPVPLIDTFVFDLQAGRTVTLDDLFADPKAMRVTLADYARKALYAQLLDKVPGGDKTPPKVRAQWQANMRGMIDPGTAPTAKNFRHFLIASGGLDQPMSLTLVFPPYQVAPYVYGVQTVHVPLKVFADGLKPRYRAAFGLAP